MSDLTKNKMSELMMGENNHRYGKKDSKETIERKTNSHVKTDHFFISPENTIVNIRNLRKFCDENNLNQGAMYGIYKGRINIHKGWRRYENHNN